MPGLMFDYAARARRRAQEETMQAKPTASAGRKSLAPGSKYGKKGDTTRKLEVATSSG